MPAPKPLDWHFARPKLARHYLDTFRIEIPCDACATARC